MSDTLAARGETERAFRILVNGSYRDITGGGRFARGVLDRLVDRLVPKGFDVYTQRHPRATELAGQLAPAPMTRRLEELSDLVLYVAVPEGRGEGWASEISDIQARYPAGAWKRAVLIHSAYPLSAILDNTREGHLSEPFVPTIEWETEEDLARVAQHLAVVLHDTGRLPSATQRPGRLRI